MPESIPPGVTSKIPYGNSQELQNDPIVWQSSRYQLVLLAEVLVPASVGTLAAEPLAVAGG